MLKRYLSIGQSLRVLLSVFFLFSGMIKLNDPLAFSLKIEAYFRAFAFDFHTLFLKLIPYSLAFAMGVCILEVLLGIALLIQFQTKFVLRALFILTTFFTLLTFYTLYFKRVDSCGCLSQAIPLTPYQSFIKNILLLLTLHLINKHTTITTSNFSVPTSIILLALSIIGSTSIGWYTIHNLPIFDFGRYPVGTHIPSLMKANQSYWPEEEGHSINSSPYPLDSSYHLIKSTLPNHTNNPLINPFIIWDDEKEITQEVLQGNKLLCIVKCPNKLDGQTKTLLYKLIQHHFHSLSVVCLLPLHEHKENLPDTLFTSIGWGSASLLEALIRGDIGCILLQDGVVSRKWSHKNLLKAHKELAKLGL